MKLPIQSREKTPLAATLVLIAAGIAGWFSVPPPESLAASSRGGRSLPAPVLPPSVPATPATAAARASSSGTVASRLERGLLTALDPGANRYSGERLMELCLDDHAGDLPGGNEAFNYAWRWAKAAPEEMYAWFRARGENGFSLRAQNSHYGFGNAIFSGWAKKDPERAAAAALETENPSLRRSSLSDVISALRATDPARAAALTAEHAALLVTPTNSSSPFSAYGKDYQATWDFLNALPPGKDRGGLLARFLDEMSRYHHQETGDLWKELSPESRQELVAGGFSGRYLQRSDEGNKQPSAPLENLTELRREQVTASGDSEAVKAYLRTEAVKWAEADPAAAIAWSQEHVTGEARVTGTARLFRAGAGHQFDATLAAWQSLPDGGLRARAAGHLAAGAPAGRKTEAEALISTLSPADQATAKAAMRETQGTFQLNGS